MPRLEGKVALISGGARGQGAVEARMFAREGAKVVIGDILDAEGQQVEAEINEGGGECVYLRLDVTSEADWQQAVETAVGRFGKLDVLVNNAGIGSPRGPDGERVLIETLTEDQWDRTLDVNAKGVFLGTRAAIPEMRKAGGGSIINISSVAGLVSGTTSAYGASKGAVRLFTKATAIQYAREGIRANSVHPGVIITAMTESMLADEEGRVSRAAAKHTTVAERKCTTGVMPEGADLGVGVGYGDRGRRALGGLRASLLRCRPGPAPHRQAGSSDPEDVAHGVLFLARSPDESSFMTGSELPLDRRRADGPIAAGQFEWTSADSPLTGSQAQTDGDDVLPSLDVFNRASSRALFIEGMARKSKVSRLDCGETGRPDPAL